MRLIAVIDILFILGTHHVTIGNAKISNLSQCEMAIKEIGREDHETIMKSPSALYNTMWLSQECEVQAGPQYVIRKYTFFENNTFLLLRFYYVDESCSIASYTVAIRGIIYLQGASSVVPGAFETKFHVDSVHITPLNQQITYKLEIKFNQTCGPRPKWKIYNAELIYEQSRQHSSTSLPSPIHNSLQVPSPSNMRLGMDCLKSFGIEFDELRLMRIEERPTFTSFGDTHEYSRLQLLLANPVPHVHSGCCDKPTSLQPTAMVRADMTKDCPLCKILSRSTENSPSVLHQSVALPAMIGGHWHSERCESSTGGIWLKRQFQMHSGDRLWAGRWDYYNDPQCKEFQYTTIATGNYVQRAVKREYYGKVKRGIFLDYNGPWKDVTEHPTGRKVKRQKRSVTDGVNQYLQNIQSSTMDEWRIAAMLRSRRTSSDEATTETSSTWNDVPTGITELDLHVIESMLIPEDAAMIVHCSSNKLDVMPAEVWEERCFPRSIEAPSILKLRAKLTVNWNGQYILLLGEQDDYVWQAPLRQCAVTPPHNPELKMYLHRSFTLRLGLLSSTATTISPFSIWFRSLQFFLLCVCIFLHGDIARLSVAILESSRNF